MHLKRKRIDIPLPAEYSRVTNPERLLPLLGIAVDLMSALRDAYEVIESSTFERAPKLRPPFEYDRAPITLKPVSPNEAPISIAFTTFPGLFLRCGHFLEETFPVCACDACAPTVERETERLQEILGAVVAGHFREQVDIPLIGSAHLSWSLGSTDDPNGSSWGRRKLSRDDARKFSTDTKRNEWQRWTKRTEDAGT